MENARERRKNNTNFVALDAKALQGNKIASNERPGKMLHTKNCKKKGGIKIGQNERK